MPDTPMKDSKIEPAEMAEYSAIEQAGGLVIISHYIGKLNIYKMALRD